jgi:hypothetical protein
MSRDDPNTLAGVLSDTGRPQEAERWRVRAPVASRNSSHAIRRHSLTT